MDKNEFDLNLIEVYQVFKTHWNEAHRIWIHTNDNVDYNIKLSLNDFLHFTRIDKVLELQKMSALRKLKYIDNKISSGKINFDSIERTLTETNQHIHFVLKKQAVIALAWSIKNNTKLFNEICTTSNAMFVNVNPDFVLSNNCNNDRYLLLCKKIETQKTYLNNLSYAKSLMYCSHKHIRYDDFKKYKSTYVEEARFVKRKGNDL